MLMLCWFYCIPFAKFAYFASSAFLIVFALFALKRGIYQRRRGLRTFSFALMFLAAFKTFMVDARLTKKYLLCEYPKKVGIEDGFILSCDDRGLMLADVLGAAAFIALSLIIFHFYKAYTPEQSKRIQTPEESGVRFWANTGQLFIIAMITWLAAPWVGYLTVGGVPKIFMAVPWQYFAIINLGLLLWGFWKAESCVWNYELKQKDRMKHLQKVWTPRDTLWMNVFLYLIALALSYVAHDVLTPSP